MLREMKEEKSLGGELSLENNCSVVFSTSSTSATSDCVTTVFGIASVTNLTTSSILSREISSDDSTVI